MNKLYFLHGLKGSPYGTKAVFFQEYFKHITIPSLPENIYERADIINNLILEPSFIIGSSLGGLSAIMFAMEKPNLVSGLVLLAPAVGFFDENIVDNKRHGFPLAQMLLEG